MLQKTSLLTLGSAVILASSIPTTVSAQGRSAPFTVAEIGRSYQSLQQAVNAIGGGRGTIVIAPGTYQQCAVQERGRIAYRAEEAGSAIFRGRACEGKAALVLRGEGAFVEGLVFANISVPDGNGAGIRFEGGDLTVTQSWFRDSEQGILTTNEASLTLRIDKSTFSRLGTCEGAGGCAHSVYAGNIAEAVVTNSRFEAGSGGHYLKSRAARTVANNNSFDDSSGRGTNYMIDLPNAGGGEVIGNWFVQGRDKENYSAFIAVGAEGARNSADDLRISNNDARFVPGLRRSSTFVADWTGDRLIIQDNALGAGLQRFERR